jgi:hypothetical protein
MQPPQDLEVDTHGISGRFPEERAFHPIDQGSHVDEVDGDVARKTRLATLSVFGGRSEESEIRMRTPDAFGTDAPDFAD